MSDLTLDHGTSRYLDVAVTNESGVPISIAGSTFWFTVKTDYLDADSAALFAKETGSGITIVDGPGGLAQITISAADWALIPNEPGAYVWDLTEKDALTRVWRLDRGVLIVVPAVQEVLA